MRIHKVTAKGTDITCGLHGCLRRLLQLAKWAGFFPVQGLGQTSADETRFKIKCVYSCYFIASLIGQAMMSGFSILASFEKEVNLNTISDTIFYVSEFISAILLLKFSQQWPKLIAKAAKTEQGLTELKLDYKTTVQTSVIAYVVMALTLVEHILYVNFNIKFIMSCLQETKITSNVVENHFILWMPHVFNYVPYSAFSAFLFEVICIQASFLWSFNDVIIICFSIYITAYFRNLNEVIASNVKKDKDTIPWATLRVHYSNLVNLIKEIDAHISSFILIAFFTDLYFICLQLFNTLHRHHVSFKYCDEIENRQVGPIVKVVHIHEYCSLQKFVRALRSPAYLLYYLYSFIFLVLRTLMLSLFASDVHCASLEPVYSIYELPTSLYDIEVQRFQLQLHHTKVGLSGKFFKVTRSMILKIVGTIITYEIVLLQYVRPENNNNGTTMATIINNVTNVYGQNK